MGQEKGRSISKRNKERCEKAPGSGNQLGPSLFSISSFSLELKTQSKATGRRCREPQTKNQEGPVLLFQIKKGAQPLEEQMPELPVKPRGARALPGWKQTKEGMGPVSISSSRMENTQLTSERSMRGSPGLHSQPETQGWVSLIRHLSLVNKP